VKAGHGIFMVKMGHSGSYYTNASGETISSQHSGKRYLKYKAFLVLLTAMQLLC